MGGPHRRRILEIVASDRTFTQRALPGGTAWVGRCIFCRSALVIGLDGAPWGNVTVEHILARGQGGDDALENLALACVGCNQEKGSRHDNRRGPDAERDRVVQQLQAERRRRWREPDEAVSPPPGAGGSPSRR